MSNSMNLWESLKALSEVKPRWKSAGLFVIVFVFFALTLFLVNFLFTGAALITMQILGVSISPVRVYFASLFLVSLGSVYNLLKSYLEKRKEL